MKTTIMDDLLNRRKIGPLKRCMRNHCRRWKSRRSKKRWWRCTIF